jgi:hypothetical protein
MRICIVTDVHGKIVASIPLEQKPSGRGAPTGFGAAAIEGQQVHQLRVGKAVSALDFEDLAERFEVQTIKGKAKLMERRGKQPRKG